MALISLAEAAKLVGKSKPTLLRARQRGFLTMERNHYNEWVVETSELTRLYPQAKRENNEAVHVATSEDNMSLSVNHDFSSVVAANEKLERVISSLEKVIETQYETISDIRDRLDASEEERRAMTKTVHLLTHDVQKANSSGKWIAVAAITITVSIALIAGLVYVIKSNLVTIN